MRHLEIIGVACFAMYRLICHLNLWKRIDYQGARNEHLNNRFFTIASNEEISMYIEAHHATARNDGLIHTFKWRKNSVANLQESPLRRIEVF